MIIQTGVDYGGEREIRKYFHSVAISFIKKVPVSDVGSLRTGV